MISHRIFSWRHAAIMTTAMFALAACERMSDTTQPLSPVARSNDGRPGDVGNASGGASINVRLLVSKAGVAILEVSTAPFADGISTPVPNGLLKDVQYKLMDPTGKQRYVGSISLRRNVATAKDTVPPTLRADDSNHQDGEDHHDRGSQSKYPTVTLTPDWKVVVEAHVVGFVNPACGHEQPKDREHDDRCKGGDSRDDVVRSTVNLQYNPDIDLTLGDVSARPIKVAGPDPLNPPSLATLTSVKKGDSQWYQVTFSNTGPAGRSDIAVLASCEVRVNGKPVPGIQYAWTGVPQQPGVLVSATPATGNIGTPILIHPNEAVICSFKMALNDAVGSRDLVTVIARAIDPLDYDTSNNEVSDFIQIVDFTVTPPSGDASVTGTATQKTDELLSGSAYTVLQVATQNADVSSLQSLIVDPAAATTFTLTFDGWTGKPNASAPALLNQQLLLHGTWTDDVSTIIALATVQNSGQDAVVYVPDASRCISAAQRRAAVGATVTLTSTNALPNGGRDDAFICVETISGTPVKYKLTAGFHISSPPTSGTVPPSSFVQFDQAVRFSLMLDVGTFGRVGLDSQLALTDDRCASASPLAGATCRRTKGWQPLTP